MYKQGIALEPGVIRDLLAHCEAYTITRLFIDSGTLNSFHSHSNSQAIFIMSGKGVFRTGAEYEEVIPGKQADVARGCAFIPRSWKSTLGRSCPLWQRKIL